jgi:hypothetical protein
MRALITSALLGSAIQKDERLRIAARVAIRLASPRGNACTVL